MTKEDVEKKIKEILDKDPRYKDSVIKINFKTKKSANNFPLKEPYFPLT